MILVTGATGKVGRHLVAGLLAEGAAVRALTRDPASAKLPPAAELAHFAPGQPETISRAVADTTAVFINATAVGAQITGLMAAAASAGVDRAVLLSSFTVRDDGTQLYSIGSLHKALEEPIASSPLDWAFLRCGGFAANTLAWAQGIRTEGVVRAPYLDAATAPIAEQDIAAAAVTVLLGDGHSGARYVLTGPQSLTQTDQAHAIGAAIGRNLRTEELPPEVFRRAASTHMAPAAVDDRLRYLASCVGRTAEMSPDLEKLMGRAGTTFAEWAHENASSFR